MKKISSLVFFAIVILINNFSNCNIVKDKNILRVGFLSSWNVKCGISMYTKHLVEALGNKGIFYCVMSNSDNKNEHLRQIVNNQIRILHIQYHPGLFSNTDQLICLLKEVKARGIDVVLTVHAAGNEIEQIAPFIDKIILHKKNDYLINEDISKKITYIPMAVPQFDLPKSKSIIRKKYSFNDADKILVTNGFMFSFKQHANILNEFVIYLKKNSNYKVQLLTAFNQFNKAACDIEFNNIKKVIEKNNLQDQVIHITDFISQNELNERIWISDIGYLWMDGHTDETSAAAKEFISARLPLVVCDSSHFHDLKKGVVKTPIEKTIFAKKVFETLESEKLSKLRSEMEAVYEELNYGTMVDKIIKIYIE